MEVRQLNTLIRAAQFQSFSKAAESLGYSQSAVTVQIKALEEELGVRLFDRMGKRVILTAQGQCFLEYANSILDTIHNARRALSEDAELEGCLHIGTLESLCFFRLPGLMHQFRVEHPKVSLRVTTGSPEELIEKMDKEHPGRVENIFKSLGRVAPSHLMDQEVFDFVNLKAKPAEETK